MMDSILDLLGDVAELSVDAKTQEALKKGMNAIAKGFHQMEDINKKAPKKPINNAPPKKQKDKNDQIEEVKQEPIKSVVKEKVITQPSYTVNQINEMTTKRLQEGIVLSEILGPPVSRKRKNRIGRI